MGYYNKSMFGCYFATVLYANIHAHFGRMYISNYAPLMNRHAIIFKRFIFIMKGLAFFSLSNMFIVFLNINLLLSQCGPLQ